MKFSEFLEHCTACGGNWTAMLMTGIKEVFPEVYDKMEDRRYNFIEVTNILKDKCGVTCEGMEEA